jgi:prephenate dehydratase
MKIGYLGPDGTFSQLAASKLEKSLSNVDVEKVAYASIPSLIAAAGSGEVDAAVLPIENSLEGGVNTTLDCLAFECDLSITKEILIKVRQNLLSKTDMKNIKKIYSHPQPIGQCSRFLAKNFSNVEIVYTNSTAQAAAFAAKDTSSAALGGESLADKYSLNILAQGIEDNPGNTTRFVVAKKNPPPIAEADKTSIVFNVDNKPGALFKMLSIFDIFGINMVKIESRPAKTVLGEYVFFVDINGSTKDENIERALEIVKYKSTFFKILGTYKEEKNGRD